MFLTFGVFALVTHCGDDDGQSDPVCGNGLVEPTEACDDGADNGATVCGCQSDCQLAATDVVCRAPVGPCDATELCDGAGGCPADALLPQGAVCRPAGGLCDKEELCSGESAECSVDLKVPAGTVCRHSQGQCDPSEACDGDSPLCPVDAYETDGATCTECSGASCECLSGQCVAP